MSALPSIAVVVGARPQLIKAAPLCRALSAAGADPWILHTGQHFDELLSGVFFEELSLPAPRYHLGVSGGSHAQMLGRMLQEMEGPLAAARPDWVVVIGDTNSTLAGALCASSLGLPLAHVEAGLRSGVLEMPEERNRLLADHLSARRFCPTAGAAALLAREGITEGVEVVGDLMYDLALQTLLNPAHLARHGLTVGGYLLFTAHRAELCARPAELAARVGWAAARARAEGLELLWPAHPRALAALREGDLLAPDPSSSLGARPRPALAPLRLLPPVGYAEMASLTRGAREVITDSGGLQREAFFYEVPCTTLRDESEWPETVACGWSRLWPQRDRPLPPVSERRSARDLGAFGRGDAAARVARALLCSSPTSPAPL